MECTKTAPRLYLSDQCRQGSSDNRNDPGDRTMDVNLTDISRDLEIGPCLCIIDFRTECRGEGNIDAALCSKAIHVHSRVGLEHVSPKVKRQCSRSGHHASMLSLCSLRAILTAHVKVSS
nr:hypothetical protein CFP56_67343 [Quercus suber]